MGQAADYTALAVLERKPPPSDYAARRYRGGPEPPPPDRGPFSYDCRHLERLKLGTPYPAVAERVGAMLATPELRGRTTLVVDATGVGRPVVDMLVRLQLRPVPITITGGDKPTTDGSGWRVPKRDLVGAVQVLLQTERIRFAAALPTVPALVQELLAFRVKISADTAHDSYGAWREGAHDDLVLAVAVAVWYGERYIPPRRSPGTRTEFTGW